MTALIHRFTALADALQSGRMTVTELPGGAIVMLARTDEMLTINAAGAWLLAELAASTEHVRLVTRFAQHFGLNDTQAQADVSAFVLDLSARLG
jgi:hypothetical protein